MASKVLRHNFIRAQSSTGATPVVGQEVHTGGNPVVAQFDGPAALGGLEGSMDKKTWKTLIDDTGTPVATLDTAIVAITRPPAWVRQVIDQDAGGPRRFDVDVGVVKESS